jgi:hypothetical protein
VSYTVAFQGNLYTRTHTHTHTPGSVSQGKSVGTWLRFVIVPCVCEAGTAVWNQSYAPSPSPVPVCLLHSTMIKVLQKYTEILLHALAHRGMGSLYKCSANTHIQAHTQHTHTQSVRRHKHRRPHTHIHGVHIQSHLLTHTHTHSAYE